MCEVLVFLCETWDNLDAVTQNCNRMDDVRSKADTYSLSTALNGNKQKGQSQPSVDECCTVYNLRIWQLKPGFKKNKIITTTTIEFR